LNIAYIIRKNTTTTYSVNNNNMSNVNFCTTEYLLFEFVFSRISLCFVFLLLISYPDHAVGAGLLIDITSFRFVLCPC